MFILENGQYILPTQASCNKSADSLESSGSRSNLFPGGDCMDDQLKKCSSV